MTNQTGVPGPASGSPLGGYTSGGAGFDNEGPPGNPGSSFNPPDAVSFGFRAMTSDYVGLAIPVGVAVLLAQLPGSIVGQLVPGEVGKYVALPIAWFVGLAAQSFIMGGVVRFVLEATQGQKPDFGLVFSGAPYFGQMFIGSLLSSIGILLGLALCIVPGVFLMLCWFFFQFVLVDKNLDAVEALKESYRMTEGQRGNLLVYSLIMLVIAIAGVLLCCLGVFLLSVPIGLFSAGYAYRKLQGQEPVLP